jgi:hypothetical protein
VDVIGQDDPGLEFDVREMARDALPHRLRHAAQQGIVTEVFTVVGGMIDCR